MSTNDMPALDLAPPGIVPTAQQWVAKWNTLDVEGQEQTARRVLDAAEVSARCFTENHQSHIKFLTAEVARLRAQVDAVRALCGKAYRSGPEPWLDARDVCRALDTAAAPAPAAGGDDD